MLLTRSIRRKMVTGLAVLLVTLMLLSVGGISGLSNYRRMVKDLEFSISTAPRNANLAAAIGRLINPLAHAIPHTPNARVRAQAYGRQRAEFEQTIADVRSYVDLHYQRLDAYLAELRRSRSGASKLSQGPQPHYLLYGKIRDGLDQCAAVLPLLEDPDRREDAIGDILRVIAEIQIAMQHVPDPANDLIDQLARDKRDYRWHLGLVWSTSITAVVLFLSLALCGYRWIVRPIRDLQKGASRVAAGDFDYRIDLETGDEISALADAFNHMTERFQSVTQDLDNQVQQQTQQLVQSARLAGVGFLAAGVAHEINNPLHAIATAAEGLEYRLLGQLDGLSEVDRNVVRDYLSMMQTESARCREITEKLLDFARGKGSEKNQYDVTAIVDDTVSVLEHVGKFRDRTIRFDVEAPRYAFVNGSEVKQVVLNLVANALEATAPGGEVAIDLRETPDYVELTCRDNGCGMAPDVLEHIFDPFYSTKQNQTGAKGTGLGLSISHRIVQEHHGTLEAMSDGPGLGSTFRLRLPKSTKAKSAA